MNPVFKFVDRSLEAAASGLKAFSMTFTRNYGMSGINLLPRTRYNYGNNVGQGLGSSIIVALISWAARNFTEAPIRIRRLELDGTNVKKIPILPADTGPGAMLTLLQFPNEFYSGNLMMKACLVDRMTTANAYILKARNASGRVVELWWAPAILVRPRWSEDGSDYIHHYEYNPNGVPIAIDVQDVIHFRDGMDPKNPRVGLNRMASLVREIFTDDEASNYSATLLANLGVPGVIISPKDTGAASTNRLSDPEGIKQKFMERFGGDKRGEPLVLTGPTQVDMLAFNPEQMGLTKLRRLPEERASGVFGIPAIVAGLGAGLDRSTYANIREARQAAYEEFMIPTQSDMAVDLRTQLLPDFADRSKYEVDFDTSNVRALQEDQNNLWSRNLDALSKGGITRRTFKENIGEDFDKTNDEVYYIPIATSIVNADDPPPPVDTGEAVKPILPITDQPLSTQPLIPRNAAPTSNVGNTAPVGVGSAAGNSSRP